MKAGAAFVFLSADVPQKFPTLARLPVPPVALVRARIRAVDLHELAAAIATVTRLLDPLLALTARQPDAVVDHPLPERLGGNTDVASRLCKPLRPSGGPNCAELRRYIDFLELRKAARHIALALEWMSLSHRN